MKLKFNIPRTEDPATCSTHQPRYVRVVPEATWRLINADIRRLTEAESLFDADIVEIIYGPPCPEYEPECACCRAWKWVGQAK